MERVDRFQESLRKVVATKEGRDVLCTLLELTGHGLSAFNEVPERRDFALGRQSIGFAIQGWLEGLEPHAYPQFLIRCEEDEENERRYDEQ